MRYSRQVLIPGIGQAGQMRLESSFVVVVGCGALGTVASELMVRAGVGRLRVIDRDFVEESNLQRQSLFTEQDAALAIPKAVAAEKALHSINSRVQVEGLVDDLTSENVERICRDAHLLLDASDNFETRFLVNDLAVKQGIPWIYGACLGTYGISAAFEPGYGCLQCLLPQAPASGTVETCETAGIWGPVVHVVAAYQTARAMKILMDAPRNHRLELLQFDVWENRWKVLAGALDPACRCCVRRDFRYLVGEAENRLLRLCGRNAVQVTPAQRYRPDFQGLSRRLAGSASIRCNEYVLRISLEDFEITLFADGRSIIKGTDDLAQARALYARYVGV